MNEELKNKIRDIVNEIYSDVKSELPSDLDFNSCMVEMVGDRLSSEDIKEDWLEIDRFIRSIL